MVPSSLNQQTVGNIGLYYVCYRLSRLGWNVMPTARNARGVDVVAYSQDSTKKLTIQVKALSRRSPVPLGNKLDHLFADFVIVCRHVIRENPECFVLTPAEIVKLVHRGDKNGKTSYWLQPREYEVEKFRENWDRIGLDALTAATAGTPRRHRRLAELMNGKPGSKKGASGIAYPLFLIKALGSAWTFVLGRLAHPAGDYQLAITERLSVLGNRVGAECEQEIRRRIADLHTFQQQAVEAAAMQKVNEAIPALM
jgi:hypothetical protein